MPADTRIGRIALRVADVDELTQFYRDVVGLDVLERTGDTVALGSDEDTILILQAEPDAAERPDSATGLYHAAFRVPSRGALGDALDRVRTNWRLDGATDHRVSEALYLTDPEGNGVEIYRDRPREEWPIGEDGRVNMGNDPIDLAGLENAATGSATAPPGTDLGHVHLEVATLDTFESFYVDTLGFEIRDRYPGACFVAAGGYHHHLAGNVWHGRTAPSDGLGLAWYEMVIPSDDALDSIRQRLAGHELDETGQNGELVVRDPDQNELRFRVGD